MMKFLTRYANDERADSPANKFRRERFKLFRSLLETVPKPYKILDVGGKEAFWEQMNFTNEPDVEIVLLNLATMPVSLPKFTSCAGDARNMQQFQEKEFDVVFSNSVIEHVGDFEQQERMASEVRRVGKRYFVQTPNRYFPLEPHFLFPYFQILPFEAQVFLVRHFDVGWYKKLSDRWRAEELINSHRLLTKNEMLQLFPQSNLFHEKFFGFTKSFIAYGGWDDHRV